MHNERLCDGFRVQLSARLDDELTLPEERALDAHLAGCAACRAYDERLHALTRMVRVQRLDVAPDLTDAIMDRIVSAPARSLRRAWIGHVRAAAVAAALTVVLMMAVSIPGIGPQPPPASAEEIVAGVRATAASIESYGASFTIREMNFSDEASVRVFRAEVSFEAPERFALSVRDRTPVNANYDAQHYELIAGPRKWWADEPPTCVAEVPLPCPAVRPRAGLDARQPFDGTTMIPTDIILPIESVAGFPSPMVVGEDTILGRDAIGVEVPYHAAERALRSLDPFEVLRPMHPLDPVEVWVDARSWFPLRLEVVASRDPARATWAARLGLDDQPGETILTVTATSLDETQQEVPDPPRSAAYADGGFHDSTFGAVPGGPSFVADLAPYRSGTAGEQESIASYSMGLSWLKITSAPRARPTLNGLLAAQEVRNSGGYIYYTPAAGGGRRIDIYGRTRHLRLESNLQRAVLLEVARSVSVRGVRQVVFRGAGSVTRRIGSADVGRRGFAPPKTVLQGHELASIFVTKARGRNASISFSYVAPDAEADTGIIRVTWLGGIEALPPTSEQPVVVEVGSSPARWSAERGELEWVDSRGYWAVAVPTFDLAVALAVSEALS
ncbi:MAG TPA: zf-HC2 domain-containing protein [Actinomycetota bacterium]|nr:zf-HC2 domain-containing protein [Actinomycetota bacterium]